MRWQLHPLTPPNTSATSAVRMCQKKSTAETPDEAITRSSVETSSGAARKQYTPSTGCGQHFRGRRAGLLRNIQDTALKQAKTPAPRRKCKAAIDLHRAPAFAAWNHRSPRIGNPTEPATWDRFARSWHALAANALHCRSQRVEGSSHSPSRRAYLRVVRGSPDRARAQIGSLPVSPSPEGRPKIVAESALTRHVAKLHPFCNTPFAAGP